jgi:hypothetical protein
MREAKENIMRSRESIFNFKHLFYSFIITQPTKSCQASAGTPFLCSRNKLNRREEVGAARKRKTAIERRDTIEWHRAFPIARQARSMRAGRR